LFEKLLASLLKCFLFFPRVKLLLWLSILLNPLVLRWILFCCIRSYLGSSSSDHIDVSPIIPGFCINPLNIIVVLVPFFLDLSQECWEFFYVMVCCATIHTCRWWKWTIPCIMSWLLEVVEHYWSSASSKSSSTSSSTYVSTLISSWCVVLGYLVILHGVILWLCIIVLQLHIVVLFLCIIVLLLNIVVWWWYLDELRCSLSCHHFYLHSISI
jgi:hypothetical protein